MQLMLFSIRNYIGIIDAVVILIFILGLFIGFKLGFFKVILKLGSIVSGLLFSICLAKPMSKFLGLFMYDFFYNKCDTKIRASQTFQDLTGVENAKEALTDVLSDAGIPSFMAKFISNRITIEQVEDLQNTIASKISNCFANFILCVIAFLLLLIGTSIILFILRKFIDKLREKKGFRIFDGILGVVFSVVVVSCIVTLVFFIFTFVAEKPSSSFYIFLNKDLRLESGKGLGVGRWFYNNNMLRFFFDLIF